MPSSADVAIKVTPTSVVRSACKEVTALTRLNNAHIVQLLGVQVDMANEKGARTRACGLVGGVFGV